MKSIVKRLLSTLGLATAAQATHARQRAEKAELRAEALRTELATLKQRYHEATSAAEESKKAAAQAQASAEKAQRDLERAQRDVDHARVRADALDAQMTEFRERFKDTRRVATVARENVVAIETKLDLVEAAIQVLDARTRERALARTTPDPGTSNPEPATGRRPPATGQ